MKFLTFSLVACCIGLCTFQLHAQTDTIVDNSTGVAFPRQVSFDANNQQYQLEATGVATRKKLVVKVYSIAHYLQKGAAQGGDKMQAIMSDKNAKQFTIKWVRDVAVDKVQGAYQEAFHKVFSQQDYASLQNEINQFTQYFNNEAHKGDEYVLRWIPEGTIEIIINGNKVGSVNNVRFAQGLWNVWFGPSSVVKVDDLTSAMR